LQGTPSLTTTQIKLALQTGATYLPDDGLMAGGAGSVDFWQARQTTANGLSSLLGRIVGLLVGPSGAAFWDAGSMASNIYHGGGGVDDEPANHVGRHDLQPTGSADHVGRLQHGRRYANHVGRHDPHR